MIPKEQKLCFVIGPIGDNDSEQRRHADWLLKGIIKPVFAASFSGYRVERADEIVAPGSINAQVINRLLDAPLVIADMSLHNANAFYELAIRHMVRLPTIHMIHKDWNIPFDVAPYRAISFSWSDHDDIEHAQAALRSAVEETIKPEFAVENPVTHARGVVRLQEHATPTEKILLDEVQHIRERLESVEASVEIGKQRTNIALGIPSGGLLMPSNINRIVGGVITSSQPRSRQRSPASDDEFISVHLIVDASVREDPKEFDLALARANKTAAGFGLIKEFADKNNLEIDMWVRSGGGLAQHLNTLKQDMLKIRGVTDIMISP